MKIKVIPVVALLAVIFVIAGCGKLEKTVVGPEETNPTERILPSNFNSEEAVKPNEEEKLELSYDHYTIVNIDTSEFIQEQDNTHALNREAWWWYVNQAIWNRAHQDIGNNVGLECKPWASKVVQDATGFALPSTQANGYYLNAGHAFKIVDGNVIGGGTIESGVGIGNIIQMYISSGSFIGPHTAIFYRYVVYNGIPGMYWIESNFLARYTVYVRFVSFDWFRSRVGTKYSVYQAQNY